MFLFSCFYCSSVTFCCNLLPGSGLHGDRNGDSKLIHLSLLSLFCHTEWLCAVMFHLLMTLLGDAACCSVFFSDGKLKFREGASGVNS